MGIIIKDTGNSTLRKFIKILLKAFTTFNNTFYAYINETRNSLRYTSQIIYLQRLLNDTFDPVTRGIYISNANNIYNAYEYDVDEGFGDYEYRYDETPTTSTRYVTRYDEGESDYDFIIFVPNTVAFDETFMRSLVRDYVFADKEFDIIKF